MIDLLSQVAKSFPAWMTIGWIVGLAAIFVAIQAYRHTHLPIVRVHRVYGEFLQMPDTPLTDRFIRVDMACVGADVFDLVVVLEVSIERDVWNLSKDLRREGYEGDLPKGATFAWTYPAPFCIIGSARHLPGSGHCVACDRMRE